MKKVKTEDAVGLILCHDITEVRDGFKGRAFQRGHVVTQSDIPHLLNLGKRHLYVWEENAGEIHEEDAALRLSRLAQLPNAAYSGPSEGKMSLTAQEDGLFRVNRPLLDRLNQIGDITIATLPDHYPVRAGMQLAGERIVPLVCPEREIEEAEGLVAQADQPLMELIPYRRHLPVGIIVTGSEVYTGRIKDKFEPVVRKKLAAFDADILGTIFCDDDLSMLTSAIHRWVSRGAKLILMTGGMSVDPDDLTPTAIRDSGAEVVTQGVPAQPGNMFTVAYLEDVTILGVPGAAIHSETTMLDVVLPQTFAGVRFTREELRRLGAGGLCQGCKVCHWPNCTFGRY
ncbi:MAG: molybdopterin-binding protein [Oscillospiraceae bacterium]|nr:molybdopterin-binding protein [Oscillospiraceae bacterium]